MDKSILIQKVSSFFQNKNEISTIYLFGSFAKGKNRKTSDIDLGVLHNPGLTKVERFEKNLGYALELENLLQASVDVIDLENADPFFLHQVMREKILVLDKNPARRVSFEVSRRRNYFDMKHFYKEYHKQALSRLGRRASHD